jgi:hypothetical protein
MTSRTRSSAGDPTAAFVTWLVNGAVGPALVALPVNLVADKIASAAVRWFKRHRQTDDLSRLVRAASGASVHLSRDEIGNLRALLTREQTWHVLAGGKLNEKLEELTAQIVGCLPPQDGRTAEEAREAADAIARGLLEFTVYDLQPDIFQKVVLARLQQMIDQASALDMALLRMHKDLYRHADEANDLLRQVLNRQPPGPADLGEIRIYLEALDAWLNTDPWPHDQRLGGHVLVPAEIERRLRVSATGSADEQDADADELARQCSRLVILGGPGSGKTWLAKRTVRICAREALHALAADAALDEVELPLYTTCSNLVGASGDIRAAAVSTAIERIGDLGGSRIVEALCLFFTERTSRTLLVIDSLDEASNADKPRNANNLRDRLRQVDSLLPLWRVLLTSRRSSWNNQLNINDADQNHRVGELLPLYYPDDVETVIQQWFARQEPERGQALAAQIARRPSLQKAATVPLILAFYCILGGQQSLPEFRHELYKHVINRMLHAPWRSSSGSPPDPEACRAALRAWALQGAKNDPSSGLGKWKDPILTKQAQLSPAGQHAVDHIAAPDELPGFDTDETPRRFVHWSIREHLVAEHVASLPADRAAQELLPHLWYDPDWENCAPAALAMHPDREQVLRIIIGAVARSATIPSDIRSIDPCGKLQEFLVRAAAESSESDWSRETAEIISQARVDFVVSGRIVDLPEATQWERSNAAARQALLDRLRQEIDGREVAAQAKAIGRLIPTADDLAKVRKVLLRLLVRESDLLAADYLAHTLAGLHPTEDDKARAREVLLNLLYPEADSWTAIYVADRIAELDPSADERAVAFEGLLVALRHEFEKEIGEDDSETVKYLIDSMATLAETPEERSDLSQELQRLLTQPDSREISTGIVSMETTAGLVGGIARLAVTTQERSDTLEILLALLRRGASWEARLAVMDKVIELAAATSDEHAQIRRALLALLDSGAEPWATVSWAAAKLAKLLSHLNPTIKERTRAREALLGLLPKTQHFDISRLLDAVTLLTITEEEQAQIRTTILNLIASSEASAASPLANAVSRLHPNAEERSFARSALLGKLQVANGFRAKDMLDTLDSLEPTEGDRSEARRTLLEILAHETNSAAATGLADSLARLNPAESDRLLAKEMMLDLLSQEENIDFSVMLTDALDRFGETEEDRHRIRGKLITLLTRSINFGLQITYQVAFQLVDILRRLAITEDDLAPLRNAVLEPLARETKSSELCRLAEMASHLNLSSTERATVQEVLLKQLTTETTEWAAEMLIETIVSFAGTEETKPQTRAALLHLLARESRARLVKKLACAVGSLNPTDADRSKARKKLLSALSAERGWYAADLALAVTQLDPSAEHRARAALIRQLEQESREEAAQALMKALGRLRPTIRDLTGVGAWAAPPSSELLAQIRHNSSTAEWLAGSAAFPIPNPDAVNS